MRAKLISRLLSLFALSAVWIWLVALPMPANAVPWPCCSELNCEGEYADCVSWCALNYPTSEQCMDDCYVESQQCILHNCSYCEGVLPCWWDDTQEFCAQTAPELGSSCDYNNVCSFPDLCRDGTCVEAGCPIWTTCASGTHCDGGFCLPN